MISDNLGTFDSTTDLADLDGDGELDAILHSVRSEEEFTVGDSKDYRVWFNQGDGASQTASRPLARIAERQWKAKEGRPGAVRRRTTYASGVRVVSQFKRADDTHGSGSRMGERKVLLCGPMLTPYTTRFPL